MICFSEGMGGCFFRPVYYITFQCALHIKILYAGILLSAGDHYTGKEAIRIKRRKIKPNSIADAALSLLVLAGAVCLAWLGLTEVRTVPAMARPVRTNGRTVPSDIPESALAIVVDAGHGGFDGGAVGTSTGAVEAELNLSVAKLLADELTRKGFYVIMTRSDENALGSTKDDDMRFRREVMQLENVDLVVSVHMNKFGDSTVNGPMVFYMKGSSEGKKLAEYVIKSLCEAVGRPLRAANPEDLFVLRVPKAPSVLVECGFLSNADDEALLTDPEYREKLARGVAEGIAGYLASIENGDSE